MTRVIISMTVVLLLAVGYARAQSQPTLEQAATDLYQSLSPDQKKQVTLPFDSPERNKEVFPAGKRPGIQLKNLEDAQREKAIALVRSFVSDYGWEKAQAIAKQGGQDVSRFYLTFFGEPGAGKDYAWRIAEHHLTLVHVEYADGKIRSIGPILLGANPPVLWNDEEDQLIALFAKLSPAEKAKAVQSGTVMSADPMPQSDRAATGITVSELTTDAQQKVQEVVDHRLKFFAAPISERIKQIVEEQGGLKAQRIAFWGSAEKRCADGGRWDFKLGSKNFLCDYESHRGHIHMSVKGGVPAK